MAINRYIEVRSLGQYMYGHYGPYHLEVVQRADASGDMLGIRSCHEALASPITGQYMIPAPVDCFIKDKDLIQNFAHECIDRLEMAVKHGKIKAQLLGPQHVRIEDPDFFRHTKLEALDPPRKQDPVLDGTGSLRQRLQDDADGWLGSVREMFRGRH